MRTQVGSLLLASTFLTINMIATGCTVKATLKETIDTSSNILGTTSGHAWWNEDGILNPEHKAIAFITYNQANLEQDIARGSGEYLTAVGTLLDIPTNEQRAYGGAVQARYTQIQQASQEPPAARLALLQETAEPYRRTATAFHLDHP